MSQDAQTFQALLKADLENTSALLALMDLERQHLEARNLDAMNVLILDKAKVLAQIEKNDELRRNLLDQANFPNSKDGISNYINTLPEAHAKICFNDFERLQSALIKCQEFNTLNGIITNRSRKRTQQSMDIIRGASKRATLYTKHGGTNKESPGNSNPISEA